MSMGSALLQLCALVHSTLPAVCIISKHASVSLDYLAALLCHVMSCTQMLYTERMSNLVVLLLTGFLENH